VRCIEKKGEVKNDESKKEKNSTLSYPASCLFVFVALSHSLPFIFVVRRSSFAINVFLPFLFWLFYKMF